MASGGTAGFLEDSGLGVARESLTAFPEMLGGRVKTLHPRVHAGILARRDVEEDVQALEEHAIEPFDLVCVNLYPFEAAVAVHGVTEEQAVELIDIGGPALLRGAAKNFAHCAPVCRPADYDLVLDELRAAGELSAETRRALATRAFATTAAYEAAIARWFAERETFPDTLVLAFDRCSSSSTERIRTSGRRTTASGAFARTSSRACEQVHGKPLTFNNLNDLSAARLLLRRVPAAGVRDRQAREPLRCGRRGHDRGGLRESACRRPGLRVRRRRRAQPPRLGHARNALAGQFVEVLFAPGYDEQAIEVLARKAADRVLNDTERRTVTRDRARLRRVLGGLLVQDRDWDAAERDRMEVVCGSLTEPSSGAISSSRGRVVKHVTSNAIVLARSREDDRRSAPGR